MSGGKEGGGARDGEGDSAPADEEQQEVEREEHSSSEKEEVRESSGALRSDDQRGATVAKMTAPPTDGEQGQSDVSVGEQGQDDVEMNTCHDSNSGNKASAGGAKKGGGGAKKAGRSKHHHSHSSTTGSSSSKSSKSATRSSFCGSSQHTETSGGSEPTEPGREQKHKEMMQTVQEMKKRIPSERRSRSKPSTVEALLYALNCVKQVQANSEYYKLLMSHSQKERSDATVCLLEELDSITSEHALKNTDSFVVVFSLTTGRVVYASEQASSILNCKRRFLESAKFVELLYHQDVNVFYSHTAQPHLPPWNVGSDSNAILYECAQVKSFFCRIRGGKDRDGEMRYNPFRITPYLLKVQGLDETEQQPCCLALAERIISGYEAPRIPMDKRIFTTTHSPGCVFLEVDDRAVPLLGYLPQDLIGTSLLSCLHPEDRALMPAMHRKILKYAGQPPFEHSPLRFRCQNGDYVTLDTSWSSFINPWSRKVAFIIGRHKVRTSPLNEDVFAERSKSEMPVICEDIKVLQAVIYKLFLQPVHNNGSSGYGSLGSNGSHEHYKSVASSSDSNGNLWEDSHREPMTLQQICADVNKVKNWGRQAYLDSRSKLTPLGKPAIEPRVPHTPAAQNTGVRGHVEQSLEESRKQPHIPSYQQINCVDSIIRYLESCTTPGLKRKSESHSMATSSSSSSSSSEEDKALTAPSEDVTIPNVGTLDSQVSAVSAVTVAHTTAAVVGAPLTDIDLSTKAMSVVSVTSQCSYSSTIVHVPQPESEVTALEDAPMGSEPTDQTPARPPPSSAAAEEFRMVGLTKEVLSAHTQKEEHEYVDRFRHRILQSPYSSYLQQDTGSLAHSHHRGDYVMQPVSAGGFKSKSGKPKHKRPKPQDSSDSHGSTPRPSRRPPNPPHSSWPSSESSHPQHAAVGGYPMPPPLVMPLQPSGPFYSAEGDQMGGPKQGGVPAMPVGAIPMMPQPDPAFQQMQQMQQQTAQGLNPYMTPVMAVILPNFPTYPPGYPMFQQAQPLAPFNMAAYPPMAPTLFSPNTLVNQQQQQPPLGIPVPPVPGSPQPWLGEEDLDEAQPPALFSSSRSSSPLQLNLLQEELPKPAEPQSSTGRPESLHEQHNKGEDAPSESGNQDALSTSSELLDLLMQEDARSGTGSNASGSGSGESGGSLGSGSGSGSNGTSTSHTGSSNSSKYFASNDSSDTSRKARKSQEAPEHVHFEHAAVQDSIWTMIQHTPETVMMNYQMLPRDQTQVLKEDQEKLRLLQPLQPWFTQEQREELAEVHPWIQQHGIPQEIDTQGCVICSTMEAGPGSPQSPGPPTSVSSVPQEETPQEPSTAPNT
ncbi:period circadian protein homolog 3 [Alosa pseudoharengus]|uniref:period circadian protein homolog 3 n=1 Tax=Alosa pseudoharengus TaxID=34774 RepID=UPI003F8C2297